jgi:hypothetical protein
MAVPVFMNAGRAPGAQAARNDGSALKPASPKHG